MYEKYKNSYKVTEKELVSLSVYNVGLGTGNPGSLSDPLYYFGERFLQDWKKNL